jgi:hypothetical protein
MLLSISKQTAGWSHPAYEQPARWGHRAYKYSAFAPVGRVTPRGAAIVKEPVQAPCADLPA